MLKRSNTDSFDVLDVMFLLFGIFRYVKHGMGMLQQHQLLAEFEAAFTEDEKKILKDGVFEDVLRAAQVNYSCKQKDQFRLS